jgi:hypothetical protein
MKKNWVLGGGNLSFTYIINWDRRSVANSNGRKGEEVKFDSILFEEDM